VINGDNSFLFVRHDKTLFHLISTNIHEQDKINASSLREVVMNKNTKTI